MTMQVPLPRGLLLSIGCVALDRELTASSPFAASLGG